MKNFKAVIYVTLILLLVSCTENSTNNHIKSDDNPQNVSEEFLVDSQERIYTHVRVISNTVNIYSKADKNSKVLALGYNGYVYPITESSEKSNNKWISIKLDEDNVGYIESGTCKRFANENGDYLPELLLSVQLDNIINLYSDANLASNFESIKCDGIFEVFDSFIDNDGNIWYKIYYPQNKKMYWLIGNNLDELYTNIKTEIDDDFVIVFEDSELERILRQKLKIENNTIRYSDIIEVESIYISNDDADAIKSLRGLEYFDNLTSVYISNSEIPFIGGLTRLKGLEYIHLDGGNVLDLYNLVYFSNLDTLSLLNNSISDLDFLWNLPNIKGLFLADNNITDLSPIKGQSKLERLDISNNKVSNIDVLSNLSKLQVLYAKNNKLPKIDSLEECRALRILDIQNNQISDISFMKYLDNLEIVKLDGNFVTDCTSLTQLQNLNILSLKDNLISNVDNFIPRFSFMIYEGNPIYDNLLDTQPVWGISDELRYYLIHSLYSSVYETVPEREFLTEGELSLINRIDLVIKDDITRDHEEIDLSGIEHCENLELLSLDDFSINNLDELSRIPSFSQLALRNCKYDNDELAQLTNISYISLSSMESINLETLGKLRNLTEIQISETEIVKPLSELKLDKLTKLTLSSSKLDDISFLGGLVSLNELRLNYNRIKDISNLSTLVYLEYLNLIHNDISDVSSLSDLQYLTTLLIEANPVEDYSPLEKLYPRLKNKDFSIE